MRSFRTLLASSVAPLIFLACGGSSTSNPGADGGADGHLDAVEAAGNGTPHPAEETAAGPLGAEVTR